MAKKKPCLTRSEFDAQEKALRSKLRARLDDVEPIGTPAGESDVWDKVLPIDSKLVATELRPVVKELLGALFPLKFIKKGGYQSPDDVLNHLLPQLRKWCPAGVETDIEGTANGTGAGPGVN